MYVDVCVCFVYINIHIYNYICIYIYICFKIETINNLTWCYITKCVKLEHGVVAATIKQRRPQLLDFVRLLAAILSSDFKNCLNVT